MPALDPRNTDASLVVVFKNHAILNEGKSAKEGRPMFDDIEICEIRAPGSRNSTPQPATAFCGWITDPHTGGQRILTYAERFPDQYKQFKSRDQQTMRGTPLDYLPFLTEGRRAELRALNIYTAEQLAGIDGQELKNLGPGGRDMKNACLEYLEEAKTKSLDTRLKAENEAQRAKIAVLEEDVELLKQKAAASSQSSASGEGQFAEMSDDKLRDFIQTQTGHAPQGNLNRKTLVRMAMEVRSTKAA